MCDVARRHGRPLPEGDARECSAAKWKSDVYGLRAPHTSHAVVGEGPASPPYPRRADSEGPGGRCICPYFPCAMHVSGAACVLNICIAASRCRRAGGALRRVQAAAAVATLGPRLSERMLAARLQRERRLSRSGARARAGGVRTHSSCSSSTRSSPALAGFFAGPWQRARTGPGAVHERMLQRRTSAAR